MNTKDFLAHVLPDDGYRVVVTLKKKDGRTSAPSQTYYDDNLAASIAIPKFDAQGLSTYFACASYKTPASRKSDNVAYVKAFWLDIDCGDTKPYNDIKAALAALASFKSVVGLPNPTLVTSGYGLHVYWTLGEPITPDQWRHTATLLKAAASHAGLNTDPTRTTDIASILRPTDTHNFKNGARVLVRALRVGVPSACDDITMPLAEYVALHGVVVGSSQDKSPVVDDPAGMVDALVGDRPASPLQLTNDIPKPEYPPAPIEPIVEGCAIIREFQHSGGKIPEPQWRGSIGVVAFTDGGPATCHEWSIGDSRYTYNETQSKIDAVLKVKPTLCDTLARTSTHCAALCAVCPNKGRVKSPIALAYGRAASTVTKVEPAPATPVLPQGASGGVVPTRPRNPLMPNTKYSWSGHQLMVTKPPKNPKPKTEAIDPNDKDSLPTTIAICDVLFYATQYVIDGNKAHAVEFELWSGPKHETFSTFRIPTEMIGEGAGAFFKELGKHTVTATMHQKPELQEYIRAWLTKLQGDSHANNSYSRMGWHGKCFLHGDTLYHPDGRETKAVLSAGLENHAPRFAPRGNLDTWKHIVDTAYNSPGVEAFQFMIMAGFAAPLLNMFGTFGGVTVYAHSEGSGFGKSTAEQVAASAWYDWQKLQLTYKATTTNAIYATLGMLSNMPVIFDELTNKPNDEVSDMVYLISSGDSKKRCDTKGALTISDHEWQTTVLASGNMLLSEKLGQHRANSEAEVARVFEFTIDARPTLSQTEAIKLFSDLRNHTGLAGREFIRYVVVNYDEVKDHLFDVQAELNKLAPLSQKERFWVVLLACTITAFDICKADGLMNFDREAFMAWIIKTLTSNKEAMVQAVSASSDLFGQMLGELWGGVLVTEGRGDGFKGIEALVLANPTQAIVGRAIVPGAGGGAQVGGPMVYMSEAAIRMWCNKKGISAKELFKQAVADGAVLPQKVPFRLGSGTARYQGLNSKIPCWQVVSVAAGAALSLVPNLPPATVAPLTPVGKRV